MSIQDVLCTEPRILLRDEVARVGIVLLLTLKPATHVRPFFSHVTRTESRRARQIELLRVYLGVPTNFSTGGESLFFVLREFPRSPPCRCTWPVRHGNFNDRVAGRR